MNKSKIKENIKAAFPILDDSSLNLFLEHANFIKSSKGTCLISEGKRHHYFYLMLNGGVKSFYRKESKEVCSWFAFENEIVATIRTFEGKASYETIEILEDSELIQFKTDSIRKLGHKNLAISHLLTDLILKHAVFLEERLYQLQFMSSQARYKALLGVEPEILQKVSLTDIASYLGISRETLSRIRAKN